MTKEELLNLSVGDRVRYIGGVAESEEELAAQHLEIGRTYPVTQMVMTGLLAAIMNGGCATIRVYEDDERDGATEWDIFDFSAQAFEKA